MPEKENFHPWLSTYSPLRHLTLEYLLERFEFVEVKILVQSGYKSLQSGATFFFFFFFFT